MSLKLTNNPKVSKKSLFQNIKGSVFAISIFGKKKTQPKLALEIPNEQSIEDKEKKIKKERSEYNKTIEKEEKKRRKESNYKHFLEYKI